MQQLARVAIILQDTSSVVCFCLTDVLATMSDKYRFEESNSVEKTFGSTGLIKAR